MWQNEILLMWLLIGYNSDKNLEIVNRLFVEYLKGKLLIESHPISQQPNMNRRKTTLEPLYEVNERVQLSCSQFYLWPASWRCNVLNEFLTAYKISAKAFKTPQLTRMNSNRKKSLPLSACSAKAQFNFCSLRQSIVVA